MPGSSLRAGDKTTVEHTHTDALGSPVAITDASENVIEREVYEPYGSPITRPPSDQPGFTGHVADSQTGLTYMQQRYYDPQLGRFLSVDPVTAYSNPVGAFNRYWYANNNPYRFTDPDGRYVCTASKSDCASVRRAAHEMRQSFRNSATKNHTGRGRIFAVTNTLGKEGVDNGVIITTGPPDMGSAGTAVTTNGLTTLTINFSGLANGAASGDYPKGTTYQKMVSSTVFHEGYHGFQQRQRSSSGVSPMVHSRSKLKNDEISAYRGEASFFKGLDVGSPWLLFTPEHGIDEWQINEQAESSVRESCKHGGCSP